MTTGKKQKYVGQKPLIDPETGEIIPAQIVTVEERDFNFHKIWLKNFINSLDSLTNQKTKLAYFIIENLDKENKLVMTQRTLSEKSGISLATVTKAMKQLQEGDTPFLQKINSGAYRVNPEILWKGKYSSRMSILLDYKQTEQNNRSAKPEPMPEEQLTFDDLEEEKAE